MLRLRLLDLRLSRLPSAIGLCVADVTNIALQANSAESRLIMAKEAGDEGWNGSFAEMVFQASREAPYITMPRNVARIEAVAVCGRPVSLLNPFFEYLRFGNGKLIKQFCRERDRLTQVAARNNVPGFRDLTSPPQYIAVYLTDPTDNGTRVLVQGKDAFGADITTLDGSNRVNGVFVTVISPFTVVSDANGNPIPFSAITGYQKGGTVGSVQFHQMDPTSGNQVLLHTMDPSETTGWYRRYYFSQLPWDCCHGHGGPPCATPPPASPGVHVSCIVKLDPIPVRFDTDYFVLQNMEALIEECQAIRYETMDTANAKDFADRHHKKAIGLLNGELVHLFGKNDPAVNFAPFGSARLERQKIGTLI